MSTPASQRRTTVVAGGQSLAETAATRLIERIAKNPQQVRICLTGGSTPRRLYELLATEPWRAQIPWSRVHWFMTDDRFVPQDDPLSNIGMARAAFLDACAPSENVHAIPTSAATPDEAAERYERELKSFHTAALDHEPPLFDLVLMGIGPDGHTASLFPHAAALEEHQRWVVGVAHANVAPFVPRVSLTFPCLASTGEMLFLVSGDEKRDILTRALSGEDLPAMRAHAMRGETVWLLDQAAAPRNIDSSHAGSH
ncbi:6-phosphogluconolactonase [Bradyrhizobium sp. SYSU BS000235]|uniref:6-phosphogluconolactonase n=1 Tax=Bradyrhizobium sp. SYSU BS000235 TaxID=3411332 RepID=UPI003C728635